MAYRKPRVGRPPKYKNLAEMQVKIDAYFADCDGKLLKNSNNEPVLDKFGNEIYIGRHPPTVTGLALWLGFTSRQALLNYQAKREFVDAITRAKARCEQYAEEQLYDKNGSKGAQFSLKNNFGWGAVEKEADAEHKNEAMQTLADLLQRPVPDRDIKDFET